MDLVKGFIKANLAKDALDIIFWSDPNQNTFKEALLIYQSSSAQTKKEIQARAFRKLQKHKEPKIGLAILCFLDFVMWEGYCLDFDEIKTCISTEGIRNEKERIAQESFFKFYSQFLKNENCKPCKASKFDEQNFQAKVKYCQKAVGSVFDVLKSDFLIQYILSHSQSKSLKNTIVNKILKRVSSDLSILKKFINDNWSLIISHNEFSFRVNQIYEKTLFFGKQSQKLLALKSKARNNCIFQFYSLNSEINIRIQMEMLQRDNERKQFMSERHLDNGKENPICSFGTCPELLSQSSILLLDDQFMS